MELRRRGIAAYHAPIGHVRTAADVAPPDARPVDVTFMGHSSPRREAFFARHARAFAALRCEIVFADLDKPRRAGTPGYVGGADRATLLDRTRVLLNVHSTDRRYFESHRALIAAEHGCLLVTEPSGDIAPFEGGVHCIVAPLDELPDMCRAYAAADDDRQALTVAARGLVERALGMRQICESMLAWPVFQAISAGPAAAHHRAARSDLDAERQDVSARLADSQQRRSSGIPDWRVQRNAVCESEPTPVLSVVISHYNYGRFLAECLASVVGADAVPGGTEIVVVDDASTEEWRSTVDAVAAANVMPVTVVAKATNTGLADTRNVGIEVARGDSVFILDADNRIYPGCLRQLHDARIGGSYAAVYGLIRRFADTTDAPLGLLSQLPWDVAHLVRVPYIDAMALFDRGALLAVGGYSTELVEHGWFGWEDYDLWLTMAQAGLRCAQVPQVVADYRIHPASMLQQTNHTTDRLARHFHVKFRGLVDAHPDLDHYFGFPVAAPPGTLTATPERQELEALADRCAALAHEVAALRSSRSWRVTGPLRLAQRLLTGRS